MHFGIYVIAILSIVLGIFGILWGLLVSGVGGLGFLAGILAFEQTISAWGANAWVAGIFGIFVGILEIIVGFGLFARQSWAWWLAIIGAALSLIHPIVGILNGNWWGLFGLIIPGLIFYYLMKQDIKAVFTH